MHVHLVLFWCNFMCKLVACGSVCSGAPVQISIRSPDIHPQREVGRAESFARYRRRCLARLR